MDVDSGEIVGEHLGIHMWTLGQRCRIGGCLKPYYVASKDPRTQTIYVVRNVERLTFCRMANTILVRRKGLITRPSSHELFQRVLPIGYTPPPKIFQKLERLTACLDSNIQNLSQKQGLSYLLSDLR